MQLLEPRGAQEFPDARSAQSGVALQPCFVLHAMIEQHRVRFGHRVVAKPAKLERIIRTGIAEMQRVAELVEESVIVALPTMWPQHQVHFLRNSHRRAEGAGSLPFAI